MYRLEVLQIPLMSVPASLWWGIKQPSTGQIEATPTGRITFLALMTTTLPKRGTSVIMGEQPFTSPTEDSMFRLDKEEEHLHYECVLSPPIFFLELSSLGLLQSWGSLVPGLKWAVQRTHLSLSSISFWSSTVLGSGSLLSLQVHSPGPYPLKLFRGGERQDKWGTGFRIWNYGSRSQREVYDYNGAWRDTEVIC